MSTSRAIRLTFSRKDGELRLVRSRRLAMRPLPPTAVAADTKDGVGCWIDICDARGASLYRRNTPNLGRVYLEAYTGDPKQPQEVSKTAQADTVSVVVPDLDGSHRLFVRERTARPEDATKRAEAGVEPTPVLEESELIAIDLTTLEGGE